MKMNESEIIELKTTTAELKEAVIAIAAILNKHQKGELYFGISNKGEVVGQNVSDKTIRDVGQAISENIEPKIFPKIERIEIEGKSCMSVFFEGQESPYFAYGRACIRVGTQNKQMSARELKKIFNKHIESKWDRELSEKTIKFVNISELKNYLEKANEAKRIDFKFTNVSDTLNKLHLCQGEKILNATEILFCNENILEVQAAVFAGNDKITFLDIQQFKGTLFDLLKKSENYIKEHMNWRAELTGDGRKEIPEVPIRALTEALVNSLCHRDYTNPKGNEVAIFKDRIEIYNPGQFPEEVKIKNYINGKERSILRNPLIGNALFLSKDVERWGSGLKRIYDECKENNVKVKFEILKTGFLVTFYRREQQIDKGVKDGVKDGVKLGMTQEKIRELVIKNKYITRDELAKETGINVRNIEKNLAQLKRIGVLKRVGPDRGGHWEIINNSLNEDNNKKGKDDK